jgi:hypothetical protein
MAGTLDGVTTTSHTTTRTARSRWMTRHAQAHANRVRLAALRRELLTYTSPADLDELDAIVRRADETGRDDSDTADVIAAIDQVRMARR